MRVTAKLMRGGCCSLGVAYFPGFPVGTSVKRRIRFVASKEDEKGALSLILAAECSAGAALRGDSEDFMEWR